MLEPETRLGASRTLQRFPMDGYRTTDHWDFTTEQKLITLMLTNLRYSVAAASEPTQICTVM